MATRAQVRFATREEGVTFSEYPDNIHAQFYVHNDGYPGFLGVEIANSILDGNKVDSWEIEYLDTKRGDLEYIYYIWQAPGTSSWISIFEVEYGGVCDTCGQEIEDYGGRQVSKCIFVGTSSDLINKYTN